MPLRSTAAAVDDDPADGEPFRLLLLLLVLAMTWAACAESKKKQLGKTQTTSVFFSKKYKSTKKQN